MSVESEVKNTDDPSDLDERFKDDPDAKYRIYSVLSYFFILVIIGLPVWWHTTRVYRAALPLDEMSNLEVPSKTIRENSIPLSLEYDVLITLVNPEPQNLKVDLNAHYLLHNLKPFLRHLDNVANFTIKSQWLYMVELGVAPKKHDGKLVLFEEQLPHLITPLEKKTWAHLSPRPCLNLVLYVTKCNSPVYIYNKQGAVASNAFLSPRWGGINILNPEKEACTSGIYKPNIKTIINVFLIQLRELLGLRGSEEKDVVNLKMVKTKEMIDSTRRTLKSLAQLLSEINSIVISDAVAEKVILALESADHGEKLMLQRDVDGALEMAKLAFMNSEEAFSDPSLLALLYFPDDQKYAVYIPLFLPIMIPVLMSLTIVRKYYKKRGANKTKQE